MSKKGRIERLEREVENLQKRVSELEAGRWYLPTIPLGQPVPWRIADVVWTMDATATGTAPTEN